MNAAPRARQHMKGFLSAPRGIVVSISLEHGGRQCLETLDLRSRLAVKEPVSFYASRVVVQSSQQATSSYLDPGHKRIQRVFAQQIIFFLNLLITYS